MARSAREVIDEHVWGGQARLAHYRKQTEGSGVYVAPSSYGERDARLLESLLAAQALLENAMYGPGDAGFQAAVERWAALEWGGYMDRSSRRVAVKLRRPERGELLRRYG